MPRRDLPRPGLSDWWRRLTHWWRADEHASALAEEIEAHRAHIQEDLETRGLSPVEAEAASRRAMGNVTLAREDAREVWISAWFDRIRRDVRFGMRGLRREPTFTVTATLTIALGVATTATVFSVVDAELWKPLAYPHPDRLVAVSSRGSEPRARVDAISGAELEAWREGASALEGLAGVGSTSRRVLSGQVAESILVTEVTDNYFETLGRGALLGRTISTDVEDGPTPVVMTERMWQRAFDADPAVVGRTLRVDEAPVTVVGIVRGDPSIGGDPDLFVSMERGQVPLASQQVPVFYGAIGRLRSEASAAVAHEQLQAVVARLAREAPDRWDGHTMTVENLREYFTGYNWRPLFFFLGASLVVLLLSAVNVAALFLSRSIRRGREFALRGALGGGAGALTRQLLVESLLVALPAGVMGVLVTGWALGAVTTALPPDLLVRGTHIPVDWRVVVFAFGVTLVTALLCVVVPLRSARRNDLSQILGPGSRTAGAGREGQARVWLLTVQMALTLVLMAGAGLFFKSFVALTEVPLGFEPEGALAMRVSLSGPRYDNDDQIRQYAAALLERTRAMPGLDDVAVGSSSPLGSGPIVYVSDQAQPQPGPGEGQRAIIRAVSPGYFRALGISLIRGEGVSTDHVAGSPRVVIVNAYLAQLLFGEANPVGRTIELQPGSRSGWTDRPGAMRIIGVASDVKEVGINEVNFADIYVPFAQMPASSFEVIAHQTGAVPGPADQLRRAAADVDPGIPVTQVTAFEARVDTVLQTDRLNLLLISAFALVALLLAAIGIYGTTAYAVQARTREFGVRVALGATPRQLLMAALTQAGRVVVIGGAVGLLATWLIARAIGDAWYLVPGEHNGLLYNVATTDPLVLSSAALIIAIVALGSGAVPAARVTRVDPVQALRQE